MFTDAIGSAIFNLTLLFAVPFALYAFARRRRGIEWREILRRAGLAGMSRRYWAISAAIAALAMLLLILFPPSLELALQEGSPQRRFEGLGFGTTALGLGLIYGGVATGFCEEFLFRGLIAGSLGRRMPLWGANLLQMGVFTAPHLLFLPSLEGALVSVGPIALFALAVGWVRIRSGSMLGAWLVHGLGNLTAAMTVAVRTAG